MFVENKYAPYPFKPIIDDFSENPALPEEPWEIIRKGTFNHVPLITGTLIKLHQQFN